MQETVLNFYGLISGKECPLTILNILQYYHPKINPDIFQDQKSQFDHVENIPNALLWFFRGYIHQVILLVGCAVIVVATMVILNIFYY